MYLWGVSKIEAEDDSVALRSRKEGELGEVPLATAVEKLRE